MQLNVQGAARLDQARVVHDVAGRFDDSVAAAQGRGRTERAQPRSPRLELFASVPQAIGCLTDDAAVGVAYRLAMLAEARVQDALRTVLQSAHLLAEGDDVGCQQFGRGGWGCRPQVGDQVGEGQVRLVADGRYD